MSDMEEGGVPGLPSPDAPDGAAVRLLHRGVQLPKIARGCETDLGFRVLSGGQFPDFRTLADFRKDHLGAFQGLFLEVLRMCREAGLVRMGHLSLDGSKYQANASKHKAMSYGRIQEVEPQLEAEVKELLRRAAEVDEAEDAEHGPEQRGMSCPKSCGAGKAGWRRFGRRSGGWKSERGAEGRSVLKRGVWGWKRRQPPQQGRYPSPRSRAISPTRRVES